MTNNVLISILGRKNWGAINAVWAMMRKDNYIPSKVYILGIDDDMRHVDSIKSMLNSLISQYGQAPDIVTIVLNNKAPKINETVRKIVDDEKKSGGIVAIELTASKKQVAFSAMAGGFKAADHVYYLYIESLKRANQPYLMIPLQYQDLRDIKDDKAGVI